MPTEAELAYAARAAWRGVVFASGDEFMPKGQGHGQYMAAAAHPSLRAHVPCRIGPAERLRLDQTPSTTSSLPDRIAFTNCW